MQKHSLEELILVSELFAGDIFLLALVYVTDYILNEIVSVIVSSFIMKNAGFNLRMSKLTKLSLQIE